MDKQLRAHTGRRREALDLLRSLTTGAVVAGAAGTVGFGALAAATFTGKATTPVATTDAQSIPYQRETTSGTDSNENRSGGTVSDPRTSVTGQQGFGTAPTPRPASGHQGHAATGGSG